MPKPKTAPVEPAGWRKRDWCQACGIGVSTHDDLSDQLKPASVRLGRRRIIIESPRDWLLRVGQKARP